MLTMFFLRVLHLLCQSKFPVVWLAGFENFCCVVEAQTMPKLLSTLHQLHGDIGQIGRSVIERPILHSQDTVPCYIPWSSMSTIT